MQNHEVHILSTKRIDEALLERARSNQISIETLAFIKTEPLASVEVQQEIDRASTLAASVVFTSGTAVESVANLLDGEQPAWRIFCIGYATRLLVEEHFGPESVEGAADNAAELAALITENHSDEVFFFCGDQRRDELPELLERDQVNVTEVVVYQTVATPQKLRKQYQGVLFFSPSAVQSFFQLNQADGDMAWFAIGNTTANEIRKMLGSGKTATGQTIIVSRQPTKETIVETVIEYFQKKRVQH